MTLRPAAVFSDHMVLQRDRTVPVWGTAAPGAQVTCRLDPAAVTACCQADGSGCWRAGLPALPAGGPYLLTIVSDGQTVRFSDVWLGEVWLAGGQSNMELPLANSRDSQAVLARCGDPRLHFYKTPKVTTPEAAQAAPSGWQKVTPATAANLSAVAYYGATGSGPGSGCPCGHPGMLLGRHLRPLLDAPQPAGDLSRGAGADPLVRWTCGRQDRRPVRGRMRRLPGQRRRLEPADRRPPRRRPGCELDRPERRLRPVSLAAAGRAHRLPAAGQPV